MALATASGKITSEGLDETLALVTEVAAKRAAEKNAAAPEAASTPATAPRAKPSAPQNAGERFLQRITSGELGFAEIVDAIEHRIPTLLFLGVPLFALLLKLVHLRSGRYYIEHLVFSLHLHTWAFLVIMVGNGYLKLASLGPRALGTATGWLILAWCAWYVLVSFRHVYAQSWPKTALKIGLLALVHGFLLLIAALLLVVGTVFWLALA